MKHVKAVIGTNAWGGKAYGKLLRGSYVEDAVIQEAMQEAAARGLTVYDLAQLQEPFIFLEFGAVFNF